MHVGWSSESFREQSIVLVVVLCSTNCVRTCASESRSCAEASADGGRLREGTSRRLLWGGPHALKETAWCPLYNQLVKVADKDHSGGIDFEEFVDVMFFAQQVHVRGIFENWSSVVLVDSGTSGQLVCLVCVAVLFVCFIASQLHATAGIQYTHIHTQTHTYTHRHTDKHKGFSPLYNTLLHLPPPPPQANMAGP